MKKILVLFNSYSKTMAKYRLKINLSSNSGTHFTAGYDFTSGNIYFTDYFMISNPDIFEKVEEPTKKEIEKIGGIFFDGIRNKDVNIMIQITGKLNQVIDAINLLNKEIAELKGK